MYCQLLLILLPMSDTVHSFTNLASYLSLNASDESHLLNMSSFSSLRMTAPVECLQ